MLIRDHMGSCFDPSTMGSMTWSFLPPREEESNLVIDVEQGICIMPTTERWHCVLTDTEEVTSPDLHLFDWQPYKKGWGDPYLSMRNVEDNPADKALTLSEWFGMKIWQIATIPPIHPSQLMGGLEEPRRWRYSQSGINYLTEGPTRDADRSRTPLRGEKGKDDPKGKGSGKKGKKPAKVIGTPEGEDVERVGKRYFPGPAETVPIEHRGLQVVPNTFYPKASKGTLKPSDLMIGLETYWAYKHAWRGAG